MIQETSAHLVQLCTVCLQCYQLLRTTRERYDLLQALNTIHRIGIDLPELLAHGACQTLLLTASKKRTQPDQEQKRQEGYRQWPGVISQHRQDGDRDHHGDKTRRNSMRKKQLHRFYIRSHETDEITTAATVEIRWRQAIQYFVHTHAHLS